jgi:DNA-binding response OmpR family regulator
MGKLKGRILVVDDERDLVAIITRMLRQEGHECVSALSGSEALEVLARQTIDVILLDLAMPNMSGWDVYGQLQEDPTLRKIPVILVTVWGDIETRKRAMKLGISEFVSKPFTKRELCTRIDAQLSLLRTARHTDQVAEAVTEPEKLG